MNNMAKIFPFCVYVLLYMPVGKKALTMQLVKEKIQSRREEKGIINILD